MHNYHGHCSYSVGILGAMEISSQATGIYHSYRDPLGSPIQLCDLCDLQLFGWDDYSQTLFPDV